MEVLTELPFLLAFALGQVGTNDPSNEAPVPCVQKRIAVYCQQPRALFENKVDESMSTLWGDSRALVDWGSTCSQVRTYLDLTTEYRTIHVLTLP